MAGDRHLFSDAVPVLVEDVFALEAVRSRTTFKRFEPLEHDFVLVRSLGKCQLLGITERKYPRVDVYLRLDDEVHLALLVEGRLDDSVQWSRLLSVAKQKYAEAEQYEARTEEHEDL